MISVVIPVYNSQESLEELHRRLTHVLQAYGSEYEIIFINDGSKDNSGEVIAELRRKDNYVKFIDLSRNFGAQAAISAGLKYASGDAVAIMDDDLQDPPELLPHFLDKMKDGYEVIYGIIKGRKENVIIRASYYLFYRILSRLSKIEVPLDAGDFCVISRKVVNAMNRMPESNRYLRGLRSWVGFRQIGIEYERAKRHSGKSGYSLGGYFRFALDGIFSFSYAPLRLATIAGFTIAILSFIIGFKAIIPKILGNQAVPGFPALFVAITFIGGVQLITIGLIGEYVARIYDETKKRPHYVINNMKGFASESSETKSH
ncbi:glycosyltransferase [Candidatus Marinimicrobia bacterium MT.SAG.4]|nr:glycosyltransferase [Candidatus Marinimicrobia bacterium MT.SAG.4]